VGGKVDVHALIHNHKRSIGILFLWISMSIPMTPAHERWHCQLLRLILSLFVAVVFDVSARGEDLDPLRQ